MMQRIFKALALAGWALTMAGCAQSMTGGEPSAAPAPAITLESAAPDSMRWLYGSGEAAGVSIQTWRMLADYAESVTRGPAPATSVAMGLPQNVADGVGTVSCRRADGTAKPLAVVFDVDETVILNEGYEYFLATGNTYSRETWEMWERTGAAQVSPVPGAVTGLRRLRAAGVTPVFNTNRQYSPEGAARAIAMAGLGEAVHRETLFLRGDDSKDSGDKDGRRALIAERYCVIALAGDNLGDFADIFNDDTRGVQARRTLAARGDYAQLWGQGWFAFPNPVYGDSITGTIGEVYPETHRWKPGTPRSDAPAIMNEGQ